MGGVVSITGSVTSGPKGVGDACDFPEGESTADLSLTPPTKPAAASSGLQRRTVASPSTFAPLSGVGTTDTVQNGTFLYLRSSAPVLVQLTSYDAGGDTTETVPVYGLLVVEFDPTKYLKGLAVKGAAQLEWLVTGPQ